MMRMNTIHGEKMMTKNGKMLTPLREGDILRVLESEELVTVKSVDQDGVYISSNHAPGEWGWSKVVPWDRLSKQLERI